MRLSDDPQEVFMIVDRHDAFIRYGSRFECHHNKSLIHRVINILLFNDNNEVLLQKRSKTKDLYPGYYCASASGHVIKGETYEQTAYREMQEELGIKAIKLQYKGTQLENTSSEETEMCAVFTGKYSGKVSFPKNEVQSVLYINKSDVKKSKLKFTPCAILSFKIVGLL